MDPASTPIVDLVPRLRNASAWFAGDGDALPEITCPHEEEEYATALLAEAADEIERLRAELQWYENNA